MILTYDEIKGSLQKILLNVGFSEDLASLNAGIFADSTIDGYHSHGVNRFTEFVKNVRKGVIDPTTTPGLIETMGPIERYDGRWGAGPSNAYFCTSRAVQMAHENVMACVALNNTNHWMRGGSYGWQAAEAGCIAICFTNTMPNMPPWGGMTATTGNNPLIIAVPRREGPVVLDMSMSQFSYGKMYEYRLKGTKLPQPGGFDEEGNLTNDPDAIISTRRILQTGYWKGSGLSIMIDLLASLLSRGNSTACIARYESETALSQVFICFDVRQLGTESEIATRVNEVVDHFKSSIPQQENAPVRYPGEATLARRKEQRAHGVEIDPTIWETILRL